MSKLKNEWDKMPTDRKIAILGVLIFFIGGLIWTLLISPY